MVSMKIQTSSALPNSPTGALVYDAFSNIFLVYTGRDWVKLEHRLCMVCMYAEVDHEKYSNEYSDGHKFVGNNLEYLEYKYEKSIR